MDVQEIVKAWLRANGYEGLYSERCGCEVDNLAPCNLGDGIPQDCKAGMKYPCTQACGDPETGHEPFGFVPGSWHISGKKLKE